MAEKDGGGGGGGGETNLKAKTVIKEQEREFQICATEKPLLVKILFEEVNFKASFEGREGRAVVESKRKSIPDLDSREARGTITMLFSFEEGDAKDSIIQRRHSCQLLLGVNLNPDFVNLYFHYAGQVFCFFAGRVAVAFLIPANMCDSGRKKQCCAKYACMPSNLTSNKIS